MAEEERWRFSSLRGVRWRVDLGILPASPEASVEELRHAAADSRRSIGKRSSTVGRTSKDRHGCLPPIVGQMHVSSYLYSEVEKDGILNNSAISEFVLYDIAHARRSSTVERIQCTDSIQPTFCNVVHNSISGESPERNIHYKGSVS